MARMTISNFSRSFIGPEGFLVKLTDQGPIEFGGYSWRTPLELRNSFIFCPLLQADLFVPCGGRPATVSSTNVKQLFLGPEGEVTKVCKFKYIVEGANLFFTDDA